MTDVSGGGTDAAAGAPAAAATWSEERHNAGGRGLEVRESLLAGAGLGLFATGRWPAGSIICEYRGQEHTLRQMLHLKDRTYLMALSLNLYIDSRLADGVAGPLSLGRYLNDHPDPSRINVRFEKVPSRSKALCVTTRDVEAGEELYVSYGEARGALRHAGSVSVARKTRVVTAPCPACWPVPQKYWARLGGIPGGSSYRRGISADDAAPPHQ